MGKVCSKHPELLGKRVKGDCIACANERKTAWRKANPEKISQANRKWHVNNRALHNKHKRDSAKRARLAGRVKVDSIARNEISKRYQKRHADKVNARNRARYAATLEATPSWADKEQIAMWYELAQVLSRSGVQFEVDHIVPLRSRYVTGFHTQHNLQVLPKFMNSAKRHLWWPDMPKAH